MAGAVFAGALDRDACNWPLLPTGETIKTKAGAWIFEGATNEFRLLLNAVYEYMNNKILPFGGGYMEQPLDFIEAVKMFKYGENLYKGHKSKTSETLKMLGAKRNERSKHKTNT